MCTFYLAAFKIFSLSSGSRSLNSYVSRCVWKYLLFGVPWASYIYSFYNLLLLKNSWSLSIQTFLLLSLSSLWFQFHLFYTIYYCPLALRRTVMVFCFMLVSLENFPWPISNFTVSFLFFFFTVLIVLINSSKAFISSITMLLISSISIWFFIIVSISQLRFHIYSCILSTFSSRIFVTLFSYFKSKIWIIFDLVLLIVLSLDSVLLLFSPLLLCMPCILAESWIPCVEE